MYSRPSRPTGARPRRGEHAALPAGQGELGDGPAGDGGICAGQEVLGAGRRRHGKDSSQGSVILRDSPPCAPSASTSSAAPRSCAWRRCRPGARPGEVVLRVRASALNHLDVDILAGSPVSPCRSPDPGLRGRRVASRPSARASRAGPRATARSASSPRLPPLPLLPPGPRAPLQRPAVSSRRDPGRHVGALPLPRRPAAAAARRARRRAAAAVMAAFGTSYHMLFTRAGLRAGERVLITLRQRRHRLGRRAARAVGGCDRHRHVVEPPKLEQARGAGPRPRHRLHHEPTSYPRRSCG